MAGKKDKELALRIDQNVEACLGNNRFSSEDGFEKFKEDLKEEIYSSYMEEVEGYKKPFFTDPRGLESAISVMCNLRLKDFCKKRILQRISALTLRDEYTCSREVDCDPYDDKEEMQWDVSRHMSTCGFGEPVSGFNRTPEDVIMENEVKDIFDTQHQRLASRGTKGRLYFKVIEFYRDHFSEYKCKNDEISALSDFLNVSRQSAIDLKFQARNLFYREMNKVISLDEYREKVKQPKELQKRFKKISDKVLLKLYRTYVSEEGPITLRKSIKDYTQEEIERITINPSCVLPMRRRHLVPEKEVLKKSESIASYNRVQFNDAA